MTKSIRTQTTSGGILTDFDFDEVLIAETSALVTNHQLVFDGTQVESAPATTLAGARDAPEEALKDLITLLAAQGILTDTTTTT